MRKAIGLTLLFLQLAFIIHARFTERRYFCWAPYDSRNEYTMSVRVAGGTLTADEIYARYRLKAKARDNRSIQHVKDMIRQYERTYGRDNPATVTLVYQTNGVAKEPWHWPAEAA